MLLIPRFSIASSRLYTTAKLPHSLSPMSSKVRYPADNLQIKWHGVTPPPGGQPAECSWRLNYVTGNLFSCPEDQALAHCISEDCRMGAGIAVRFKQKFNGVDELKAQRKGPGECAVLKREGRFVYYLVTKKNATQKPTYDSLRRSLMDMKSHCIRNQVTRISMPRIGCGLDRLKWDRVSALLEQVFKHTNISITVYSLPEKTETTVMRENMHRWSKKVF